MGIKSNGFIMNILSIIITFILVDLAWIFFRANTINDVITIFTRFFDFSYGFNVFDLGLGKPDLYLSLLLIIFLMIIDIVNNKINIYEYVQSMALPIRWTIYLVGIFGIILFGFYGGLTEASFIYFQF